MKAVEGIFCASTKIISNEVRREKVGGRGRGGKRECQMNSIIFGEMGVER